MSLLAPHRQIALAVGVAFAIGRARLSGCGRVSEEEEREREQHGNGRHHSSIVLPVELSVTVCFFSLVLMLLCCVLLAAQQQSTSALAKTPPFTLLPTAQFFLYLLTTCFPPCLEGHLDPVLIQVWP